MVGVRVGDDGARDRTPGIDVKIPGLAKEAIRIDLQNSFTRAKLVYVKLYLVKYSCEACREGRMIQ